MMKSKANLLDADKINRTLVRLAHEIIEKNSNLENLAIIGIRTRGDVIAKRLFSIIKDISQKTINLGTLDVTFYRDDFRTNLGTPKVGPSKILFDIDKKNIILIDDVLYTGRTIRSALDAQAKGALTAYQEITPALLKIYDEIIQDYTVNYKYPIDIKTASGTYVLSLKTDNYSSEKLIIVE